MNEIQKMYQRAKGRWSRNAGKDAQRKEDKMKDFFKMRKEGATIKKEGTWHIGKDRNGLKKLLSKPIVLGKEGDKAVDLIAPHIGDDELYDDLYELGKKNPKGDARAVIKKAMKRLGIKEAYEIGTDEYTKHVKSMTPGQSEGYVSAAQRKAVHATKADDGKGHPDNKKEARRFPARSDGVKQPAHMNPGGTIPTKRNVMDRSTLAHSAAHVEKGKAIAKKMSGNMTAATAAIEKLKKGLSKHPKVKGALRIHNENSLDEYGGGPKIKVKKEGKNFSEFVEGKAPKIGVDRLKLQRDKDRAHSDAMGRHNASGRRKSIKSDTSESIEEGTEYDGSKHVSIKRFSAGSGQGMGIQLTQANKFSSSKTLGFIQMPYTEVPMLIKKLQAMLKDK